MAKHKVSRRYLILILIMILWAALYYIGHSDYVSENLKKVILDKARQFTDQKISIQKVHVNPIPFFLELNDISVAKPGGKAWFNTERVKIYVDIVELFREKLEIRRMLVSGANVKLNRDTMALIGALSGRDSDGDGMILRTIDVRKSNISYEDRDLRINANGVNLSAILKAVPELSLNVGQIDFKSEMLSLTDIGVRGRLQIDSDIITMESITILSGKSSVKAKGIIYTESREFLSSIKGDITINDFGRVLNMDLNRDGNIRASGKIEYLNGELFSETSLSGSFFLESLMSFLDLNEPLRGMTQFSGKLKVESDEIYAHANARWINGHVHGVDIDSATCDVTYSSDDNKLRFSNGKGALYGGTADADVYITLPSVDTFMVNVKAYDVDAKDILSLINFDLDPSTGKVTGEVVSEGEQFLPEGWFDATFETSEGNILKRINRAQGKYRSVGSNMILENLNLETAESNMIINGSYHMDTETLDLHGHANTENLSDAVDPYYVGVSGSGSAMFEVTGTTESPVIKAVVRASDVSVHDFMYDDLEASFSYQKARLQVTSLIVSKGSEHHKISGTVGFREPENLFDVTHPEFDIVADIKNLNAETLIKALGYPVEVSGLVSSNISLKGSLSDVRAKADVLVRPLAVYGIPLDSLKTEMTVAGDAFHFGDLIIRQRDSVVSGDLAIDLEGNYRFNTSSVVIQLGQLPFDLNLEKGVINIELSGKGSLRDPFVKTKLRMSDVMTEGVPVGDGEIEVVLKNRKIRAEGILFDGKTAIKANANLFDNFDWGVEAVFNTGVYDFIAAYFLKEIPEDLMLSFGGELDLKGDKNDYGGSVRMASFHLSSYGLVFSNSAEVLIRADRRRIFLEQVELISGNAHFAVEGSFVPYGDLDITAYGDSSLAFFRRVFESTRGVKGFGEFVLSLTGDWENPRANGGISISKASMGIAGFPYKIVDFNSYMYVANNRLVIREFTGYIGGGKIDMKGYGLLESLKLQTFYVNASLNDATFRIARGAVISFDGNLILKGEPNRSNIVGQITVDRARYTRRLNWKTYLVKARTAQKPKRKLSRFEKAKLNIKINGSKDINIDNNFAKTELEVDLLLRGTVSSPILFGRIETDKGSVFFRNNDFEIIRASADFVDPEEMNPYLDIIAGTSIQGYSIRVALEGQIPNLDLSLVSDPPLDETDILGLLTHGEVGSELGGLEAGIGTAEATSFLTGEYQDVIEERLTRLTGLDRFEVEPYASGRTRKIGPRVSVSKRLIEDKLYVTYTSSVGVAEEDAVKLEYRLNRNVSLIGENDETGSLGGDIKFRFEFK